MRILNTARGRLLVIASLAPGLACSSSASEPAAPTMDASLDAEPSGDDAGGPREDAGTNLMDAGDAAMAPDGAPQEAQADGGPGHIVLLLPNKHWQRVAATPGAPLEDLGAKFDALAPGVDDAVSVSPNGAWLALKTSRFGCSGDCLALAPVDVSKGVLVPGINPAGRPSINSAGDRLVYPKASGSARSDLFTVLRAANGAWGPEVNLTAGSTASHHHDVAFSPDGTRVVFDCGPDVYQAAGTCVCEVHVDGTGFRQVICPSQGPAGTSANELHQPAYARDGSIVFEADWNSDETIWRVPAAGGSPKKLSGSTYDDDNSPCVLPDGRIASLWLGRVQSDGNSGLHELKVMNADGSNPQMIVTGLDLVDVGLSCGE